ncbi:hypothetical protein KY317_03320 [Candidatus Woesearchaeota archaeon]|nr:hypothetical protein [Candidatus Woesearchaeota archaeon]
MTYKKEDLGIYQTQVQTNVAFTAFMTAVVVFFTGLLLTKFSAYDISIKIPIAFLIISVFGFLYSTLVFANASEAVSKKKIDVFRKHMKLGDILSEYLGVYFLILSIPLVINVITGDLFLRIVTLIASLAGLSIYLFSHLSVMERHFIRGHKFISLGIIAFGIVLFFTHLYKFYFVQFSAACIIFIVIITYFATRRN